MTQIYADKMFFQVIVEPLLGSKTLQQGRQYLYDAGAGIDTLTLPSSPQIGQQIEIIHVAGDIANNYATIAHNGNAINGVSADIQWDEPNTKLTFHYDGTDWTMISQAGENVVNEIEVERTLTVATNGQTVFTLPELPFETPIEFYVNGEKTDDFTLVGTTLTFLNTLYSLETSDGLKARYTIIQ